MINMLSSPERVIDFIIVMAAIFGILLTLIVIACFHFKSPRNCRNVSQDYETLDIYQSLDNK